MNKIHFFLKKHIVPILITILIVSTASLPPEHLDHSFTKQLISHFEIQNSLASEKLYLHLDRPYYTVGDDIWFKVYLVKAGGLQESDLSNFIYVELVNRYDSILVRRKFKRDEHSQFNGNFTLPNSLQSDSYYLRAYTHWMRNNSPEYFYSRNIDIWNPMDRAIQSQIEYEPLESDKIKTRIRFTQNEKKPFSDMPVLCRINRKDGTTEFNKRLKTDEDGFLTFTFKKSEEWKENVKPSIEIRFQDYLYDFKQTFFIPELSPDYAVTFFPEGGKLLTGVQQNIALKAQNENGFGETISGWITRSTGDTLVHLATEHDGMGVFSFQYEAGEQYTVTTRSQKGVEKRFPLNLSAESGFALSLQHLEHQIHYQILSNISLPNDSLYLIAHTREMLRIVLPITKNNLSGAFPDSIFETGITHFILCNSAGIPLSERLIFIRDYSPISCQVSTDRSAYGKREKVDMSLQLFHPDQQILTGSYSVSITNPNKITPDSSGDNILSNLLLTSDLTGYIEKPGYYFLKNDSLHNRHLDLVMMTHGWSRFNTDSLLCDSMPKIRYPIEKGQFLTGKVKTLLNKDAPNAQISALSTKDSILAISETDQAGNFVIEPLFHQDSTWFMLSAVNKNGKKRVEIFPDEESIPEIIGKNYFFPLTFPRLYQEDEYARFTQYGEIPMTTFLKEITIVGDNDIQERADLRYFEEIQPLYTVTIDGKSLIREQNKNLLDAILTIPNTREVNTPGSNLTPSTIQYMNTRSRIFINNTAIDIDITDALKQVPIENLVDIEIYRVRLLASFDDEMSFFLKRPSALTSITDSENYYYLIMVSLNCEYRHIKRPQYWVCPVFSLGYTQTKERYQPVYETPEQHTGTPDTRNTIYWNPELPVDSSGRSSFSFYTSDQPEQMHIIIEGITDAGKIVRYESNL